MIHFLIDFAGKVITKEWAMYHDVALWLLGGYLFRFLF